MKVAKPLVLAMLALAACKKDPPATTPDNSGGDDPVAGEAYACSTAADCVAVELGCCDECNGGDAVGVNRDHVDAIVADSPRGQGACGDVACTEMACPDWVPACDGGTCGIVRGTF